jgi:hypothetical protein
MPHTINDGTFMRIIEAITIAFPLIILLLACDHSINPDDLFKNDNNLTIKIPIVDKFKSDSARIIIVAKGSEKYNKLKQWLNTNNIGWKSSIASWAPPDIIVTNNNFRLLIFKDGIVLINNENSKQYTIEGNKKEFTFLEE